MAVQCRAAQVARGKQHPEQVARAGSACHFQDGGCGGADDVQSLPLSLAKDDALERLPGGVDGDQVDELEPLVAPKVHRAVACDLWVRVSAGEAKRQRPNRDGKAAGSNGGEPAQGTFVPFISMMMSPLSIPPLAAAPKGATLMMRIPLSGAFSFSLARMAGFSHSMYLERGPRVKTRPLSLPPRRGGQTGPRLAPCHACNPREAEVADVLRFAEPVEPVEEILDHRVGDDVTCDVSRTAAASERLPRRCPTWSTEGLLGILTNVICGPCVAGECDSDHSTTLVNHRATRVS